MKKMVIAVITIMLTILLFGCGEADTQEATNNTETNAIGESESDYDLNDFESFIFFLGKPIDLYADAEYDGIGYRPELESSSNEIEATYDDHLRSSWHYIPGNVKLVTYKKDDTIVRFILEFDDDVYLNGDDFTKACDYMSDKYGEETKITDGMVDFYHDDYYFRVERNRFTIGLNRDKLDEIEKETAVKPKKASDNSDDWDMFTSLLGKKLNELPEEFTIDRDVVAYADYGDAGDITVVKKGETIGIVTYWPYENSNEIITQDKVDSFVNKLSQDYGNPRKRILDNSSYQHEKESESFIADHYTFYDGDEELVDVTASKDDGANISKLSISFYDTLIKR